MQIDNIWGAAVDARASLSETPSGYEVGAGLGTIIPDGGAWVAIDHLTDTETRIDQRVQLVAWLRRITAAEACPDEQRQGG